MEPCPPSLPPPRRPRSRRLLGAGARWIALVALATGVLQPPAARSGSEPDKPASVQEYELKRAFLERFRSFVHWPATPHAPRPRAMTLGVIGRNPFGPHLPAGSRIAGQDAKPLRLIECTTPQQAAGCDIVFFCNVPEGTLRSTLDVLADKPVLTVGEGPGFARFGGMIGLLPVDRRIRLEINRASVARAGLRIDPQLLQLATLVQTGRP